MIELPYVDLCRSAGLVPSTYSKLRTGKAEPRLSTLKRLADALVEAEAARERQLVDQLAYLRNLRGANAQQPAAVAAE